MLTSTQEDNDAVISLKEARKLLGQKTKYLTKEELELLIKDTETVVRIYIRQYIRSKKSENNDTMPSMKASKV